MEKVDPTKCYICGKIFSSIKLLQQHKNRKTPCRIWNISAKARADPNRCIHCNRIYSNKSNLKKHLSICKVKDSGLEILLEKDKFEEQFRSTHEQMTNILEDMQKMQANLEELKTIITTQKLTSNPVPTEDNPNHTPPTMGPGSQLTNPDSQITTKPTTTHSSGYVYFIIENPFADRVKIGMTHNIPKRLKQLQTCSPAKLEVYEEIITSDPRAVEKELHTTFAHKRIRGEWFSMTQDQLQRAAMMAQVIYSETNI